MKQIGRTPQPLTAEQRKIAVEYLDGDLSYKEIAAELGVSDKTVYYRVKQALRLLRSRLGEHLYSILV